MEIKQVNIQTQCIKTTTNAKYEINYDVCDEQLTKVNVYIHNSKPKQNEDSYLGSITLDGNYLTGSFPYNPDIPVNKYFEDFTSIMAEIKEIQASMKVTIPEDNE